MGSPAQVVVGDDGEGSHHEELHEVGEGRLEVVTVGKLECVPPAGQ